MRMLIKKKNMRERKNDFRNILFLFIFRFFDFHLTERKKRASTKHINYTLNKKQILQTLPSLERERGRSSSF